jgi:hypothetical protein
MPDVFNAPQQLVYPASALMALSREEINQCLTNGPILGDTLKCEVPLNIGVFFDGTNNNAKRDEPERLHTNVVRLFNAHPDAEAKNHLERLGHYRIYVPGVGTPFEANAEARESKEGKAFGKGAQARILYAVIQTLNTIYRACQRQQSLYFEDDIADLLKAFAEQVEGGQNDPERPGPSRDQWLAELHERTAQKIEHARRLAPLPRIPDIFVSVFGFSRGAAQAVAFCHWLNAALPRGQLAGMPVRIGFLGLFDCVASVGLSDAARRAMGLGMADGHFDWAKEIRQPLPALVQRVVHMSAAHEQRLNFPLTRIRAHCEHTEYVYPGVHSDVGGGYGLRSQGRSPGEGGLLSQIPLMHMHKAARAAGVPLLDHVLMDGQDELLKDYALERDLVACWNRYMAQADADHRAQQLARGVAEEAVQPLAQCRDRDVLVRQHMRLYYDFRRRSMGQWPGHRPEFWQYPQAKPSDQDGDDIDSYNALLVGDLHLLDNRKPELPCNPVLEQRVLQLQYMQYQSGLSASQHATWMRDSSWMQWALQVMRGDERIGGSDHLWLLGRYVHDSLAGFCLLGPGSREEKAEKLLELVEKKARGEKLNAYEAKVVRNYEEKSRTNEVLRNSIQDRLEKKRDVENANYPSASMKWHAQEQHERKTVFLPHENRLIDECRVFPVVSDKDASDLYENWSDRLALKRLTHGRREGGGYFLPRMVFE